MRGKIHSDFRMLNGIIVFGQETGAAVLKEIAESARAASAQQKMLEEKKECKRLASRALELKRKWHQAPDRSNFGKASPLCQQVLRAAVSEAKVWTLLIAP